VATPAQAQAVADTISHRLLAPGGLATSLNREVVGLRNYGFDKRVKTIATHWVGENIAGCATDESPGQRTYGSARVRPPDRQQRPALAGLSRFGVSLKLGPRSIWGFFLAERSRSGMAAAADMRYM